MNDIRRSILWVTFGFSLILLWDAWQVHSGRPATFFPAPVPQVSAPVASGATATTGANAATGALPGTDAAPTAPAQTYDITTDVLKLTISSLGGTIERAELLKHDSDKKDGKSPMVLFQNTPEQTYKAETGLVGIVGQATLPYHTTPMTFVGDSALKDGQNELVLRFESAEQGGVKYAKTYTLKRGVYDIDVKHEIINVSANPVTAHVYMQLTRRGLKAPDHSFLSMFAGGPAAFSGAAVYTAEKKYQKIDFADIDTNQVDIQTSSTAGYAAMVQHYFTSAWLLADGVQRELFSRKIDPDTYVVGLRSALTVVAPGATATSQAQLYVGPQNEKTLETLSTGLERVKDYGMFYVIAKPLYWVMDKLHDGLSLGGLKIPGLGNWGWTIIALVVLIKASLYWLNAKAYRSMAQMKAVTPKITEMRERLKDKPQEMQMQMMKIYKDEKVNPLGGCLPMLVQIPVFLALYNVLSSSVEFRGAPWMGWITDLSVPDPLYILPFVMACTTVLQTALNPLPPDPMQAKMMWLMPLLFSVMFFFFPSGLVLYWITNNVLSIAQQWAINTRMGVPVKITWPDFLKRAPKAAP
jgi:YidC/Oxa1 family membrane protein insertase